MNGNMKHSVIRLIAEKNWIEHFLLASHLSQATNLDQPLKMTLDPIRQLPARHEQAQLHVDGEGVLGEVGARQEHAVSIGDSALDVQDADLAVVVRGPILLGP